MSAPRRHRCTYCDELGATTRNLDAGGHVHWFHPVCLARFRWWCRGHDTPLPARYRQAAERGEQLTMPLVRRRGGAR